MYYTIMLNIFLLRWYGNHFRFIDLHISPNPYLLGTPDTSLSGLNTRIARSVLRSTPLASSSSSRDVWPVEASSEFSLRMVMYLQQGRTKRY